MTRGALTLTASQYARVALSGGLCTVAVRTMLNPLELVKTKIQLGTDDELLTDRKRTRSAKTQSQGNASDRHGRAKALTGRSSRERKDFVKRNSASRSVGEALSLEHEPKVDTLNAAEQAGTEDSHTPVTADDGKLETFRVIQRLVEIRGPLALFQSADITLLASMIFGSLGFGATELFRRSFTAALVTDASEASSKESAVILLVAAAGACAITSLVATPFETLRVRSMGLVEEKGWQNVLSDFVVSGKVVLLKLLANAEVRYLTLKSVLISHVLH